MNAFVSTELGTFKAYRVGDEWQVLGPGFERWFSVWRADPLGSLMRALQAAPGVKRHVEVCRLSQEIEVTQ
jgi:hypothetical protein